MASEENLSNGISNSNDDEQGIVFNPAWQIQQKRTFTAWCNFHLRKIKEEVDDIYEDFRDGLKLMRLLEVISSERLERPDKGKMRFHRIANVNKALKFIQDKGVRLVSIGAEEIVDGNPKMTLGMIWTIILRFVIQDIQIEDHSAKEGLLFWCKRQTEGYNNINVNDFRHGFSDGLAFCAIIHKNRPNIIEHPNMLKNDPIENLNKAFNVAEKELDIPRMLDPNDVVNDPDERSMVTYLSSFYHKFAKDKQTSMAISNILDNVRAARDAEKHAQNYKTVVNDLIPWIENKIVQFQKLPSLKTQDDIESARKYFQHYCNVEKPTKLGDKLNLEQSYVLSQLNPKVHNQHFGDIPEEYHIGNINKLWKDLDDLDKNYGDHLMDQIKHAQQLQCFTDKFDTYNTAFDDWVKDKKPMLMQYDYSTKTLPELKQLAKMHDVFEQDKSLVAPSLKHMDDLLNEIKRLDYYMLEVYIRRHEDNLKVWKDIDDLASKQSKELTRALTALQELDDLYFQYAKRAIVFYNWLSRTKRDLEDPLVFYSVPEVEQAIHAHNTFETTLLNADNENGELAALYQQIKKLAIQNGQECCNPYTHINQENFTTSWQEIKVLTGQRSEFLQNELERLKENKHLQDEIDQQLDEINGGSVHTDIICILATEDSLHHYIAKLESLCKKVNSKQNHHRHLDSANKAFEKTETVNNPYINYSVTAVQLEDGQSLDTLNICLDKLKKPVKMNDCQPTDKQIGEWRASFKHFDKYSRGRLDLIELKSCLIALDFPLPEDNTKEYADLMKELDPEHKSTVTLNDFINFMIQKTYCSNKMNLINSFKTLTAGRDYITENELVENLSPEDANYCLANLKRIKGPMGDSACYDYEDFCTRLSNGSA